VADWVYEVPMGRAELPDARPSWEDRVRYGLQSVRDIVGRVWPFVVAGIAVGAAIHGCFPEDVMSGVMGRQAWLSGWVTAALANRRA
jgi:uncharacterized protein